eukprot:Gb_33095 [translate_table: standard]
MGKNSGTSALEIDWGVSADLSDSEFDAGDDEDLESLYFSNVVPKLQFRKDVSVARWDVRLGVAEVIVMKGRMWTTTGFVRQNKVFCHIEEVLFMAERGALFLLQGDVGLSVGDIYNLLAEGNYGCTWEFYQAYCHLKSFGYIVGRHNFPWTLKYQKNKPISYNLNSSEGPSHECENDAVDRNFSHEENKEMLLNEPECYNRILQTTTTVQPGLKGEETVSLESAIENISISRGSGGSEEHKGLKLVFDVYFPNTRFRKSTPGLPDFILSIARDHPPNKCEVQALQTLCGEIPLKFASIECRRINFFSFNSVKLVVLP